MTAPVKDRRLKDDPWTVNLLPRTLLIVTPTQKRDDQWDRWCDDARLYAGIAVGLIMGFLVGRAL